MKKFITEVHMGSNKITNLLSGTAPSDAVNLSQLTGLFVSGTQNYLTKFGASGATILNSSITDNGTNINVGTYQTFSDIGRGAVGNYDPTKYQHVWSMGGAYLLSADGSSSGSMYGLAWSYNPDYLGTGNNSQSKAGLNHQLLLMMNGITHTAIGTGIWTSGVITGMSNLSIAGNATINETLNSGLHSLHNAGIGIGTANKIRWFDDGAALESTTSNSYGIGMSHSSGKVSYTAGLYGYHSFFTQNSEKLRIEETGNTNLLGYKITGLGTATAASDAVRYDQLTALSGVYHPLENQRLSTTNSPTFSNVTVTNTITAGVSINTPVMLVSGAAGTYRDFQFRTGNSLRWDLFADNSTEGGLNTGSNFQLARYADNAAYIATVFNFNRASGFMKIGNSAAAAEQLDIEGNAKITGGISSLNATTGVGAYYNVHSFNYNSGAQTGTMAIQMPIGFTNTMMTIKIQGYNYSEGGGWEVNISGYNAAGGTGWINTGVTYSGIAPFSNIRLAYNATTGKCVILLGTTSTTWLYPQVTVSMPINSYYPQNVMTGWSTSIVTSETAYSSVVTPTANQNLNGEISVNTLKKLGYVQTNYTSNSNTYRDLLFYDNNSASIPGACIIETSMTQSRDNMVRIKIDGYNYTSHGAWSVIIGSYTYNDNVLPRWYSPVTNVIIEGNAPFSKVRLARNPTNGKYVIILGDVTDAGAGTVETGWSYPKIQVSEMIAGFGVSSDLGSGWSASITNTPSVLASYSGIYTPSVQKTFKGYGIGTYAGTPTKLLGVDASGNIVETNPVSSSISGANNYVAKFNGTNAVQSSQIFDNATNVGIGTSSPSAKLDVNGTGNFGSYLTINGASNGGNIYTQYLTAGTPIGLIGSQGSIDGIAGTKSNFGAYVYGNNEFNIWTNGVKRFYIDGSGNAELTGRLKSASGLVLGTNVLNTYKSASLVQYSSTVNNKAYIKTNIPSNDYQMQTIRMYGYQFLAGYDAKYVDAELSCYYSAGTIVGTNLINKGSYKIRQITAFIDSDNTMSFFFPYDSYYGTIHFDILNTGTGGAIEKKIVSTSIVTTNPTYSVGVVINESHSLPKVIGSAPFVYTDALGELFAGSSLQLVPTGGSNGQILGNVTGVPTWQTPSYAAASSISGTEGRIAKFNTAGTGVINSLIYDNGSTVIVGVGSTASQYSALITALKDGNSLEFGHTNTAGYTGNLGAYSSSGANYLAFHTGAGTNVNTFKTLGVRGSIIRSDLNGGWIFENTASANADNQTAVARVSISNTGTVSGADATVSNNFVTKGQLVDWQQNFSRAVATKDNAGEVVASGFYETASPSNFYTGASSWQHLINVSHSANASNNLYQMQIAGSFFDQEFYGRKTNAAANTAWVRFLTSGNYNSFSPTLTGTGATGTWGISISGNAATATSATSAATLTTSRNINGTAFNGSADISTTEWFHSSRDFPNGTLITTSIDYSVTNGDPFVLEIKGNSYGLGTPFDVQIQGYIYNNTIQSLGGVSNGYPIPGLVAINVGGNLCFWFPTQGYWQGYNVKVYTAYPTRAINKVTSITAEAKPTTSTKEVALSSSVVQSLHSSNYTSYSPSLTGTGASGTWGINITGLAGSVAWNSITGTPSTFTPSAHNHAGAEITSGTVADARLSSNVPLLNAFNTFSVTIVAPTFSSSVAQGTAPLSVGSTTKVTNLNADLLDGQDGSYYQNATNLNAGTVADARLSSNIPLLTHPTSVTTIQTFTTPITFSSTSTVRTNGNLYANNGISLTAPDADFVDNKILVLEGGSIKTQAKVVRQTVTVNGGTGSNVTATLSNNINTVLVKNGSPTSSQETLVLTLPANPTQDQTIIVHLKASCTTMSFAANGRTILGRNTFTDSTNFHDNGASFYLQYFTDITSWIITRSLNY